MKSHHPKYLESFVKTCRAYGLDEQATATLLDNARHQDYLEHNPNYRQGFYEGIESFNNSVSFTKNASPLLRWLGYGVGNLGRLAESLAIGAANRLPAAATAINQGLIRKPQFWTGLAAVPAAAGTYLGGKKLYEKAKNKIDETLYNYGLSKGMNQGLFPSLDEFNPDAGKAAPKSFGQALGAYEAMRAADSRLLGGSSPLTSRSLSGSDKNTPLRSISERLAGINSALKQPVSDPSQYSKIGDLFSERQKLEQQLKRVNQFRSTVDPIYSKNLGEIEKLQQRLQQRIDKGINLSPEETSKYRNLADSISKLQKFRQQVSELQ